MRQKIALAARSNEHAQADVSSVSEPHLRRFHATGPTRNGIRGFVLALLYAGTLPRHEHYSTCGTVAQGHGLCRNAFNCRLLHGPLDKRLSHRQQHD